MLGSKQCTRCGRRVPFGTRVGDFCPYCGVRFSYEVQSGSGGGRARTGGSGFWIILALILVFGASVVPIALQKTKKTETSFAAELCDGSPAERQSAADWVVGRRPFMLDRLSEDYAAALRNATGQDKAELIRTLLRRAPLRISGGTPVPAPLPKAIEEELRAALDYPDAEVQNAAQQVLSPKE